MERIAPQALLPSALAPLEARPDEEHEADAAQRDGGDDGHDQRGARRVLEELGPCEGGREAQHQSIDDLLLLQGLLPDGSVVGVVAAVAVEAHCVFLTTHAFSGGCESYVTFLL